MCPQTIISYLSYWMCSVPLRWMISMLSRPNGRANTYVHYLFARKSRSVRCFLERTPWCIFYDATCPTICTLICFYSQALDLMEKCLTFSPKRRIDVEDALKHPYLDVSKDVVCIVGHVSRADRHTTTRRMNRLPSRWTRLSLTLITAPR